MTINTDTNANTCSKMEPHGRMSKELTDNSNDAEDHITEDTPTLLSMTPEKQNQNQNKELKSTDSTCGRDPTTAMDSQDQINALLEALRLVATLANLETRTYASTLASMPSHSPSQQPNGDNAAVLQQRLHSLHQEWKLEETALPRLIQAIHGFQSRAMQVDAESDRQIQQEHSLRTELAFAEQRVHQLEAAVRKIHTKNQTLVKKLQDKKMERTSLLRNVKDYIRQNNKKEELDEQRVAAQLRAHERILKLDAKRERTFSNDSHFFEEGNDNDDASVMSSTASVLSFQSHITYDSVPTVRLSSPRLDSQFEQDETEQTLSFTQGSNIGLQFCTVPNSIRSIIKGKLDDSLEEPQEKDPAFKVPTFNNPFHKRDGAEHAFLVCGHYGFDTSIRVPPTNGVRLVAINGETVVHGNWSLNKIRTIASSDRAFTLSFRMDTAVAKQQRHRLEEATRLCQLKHYSGGEEISPHTLEVLEEIELEGDKHNKTRMPSWMGGDKKEKIRLDSDDSVDDGLHSNRPRLPSWMKVEREPMTTAPLPTPKASSSSTSNGTPSMKMPTLPAWMTGDKTPTASNDHRKTAVSVEADLAPSESQKVGGNTETSASLPEHEGKAFVKKSISSFGHTMVRGFKMS